MLATHGWSEGKDYSAGRAFPRWPWHWSRRGLCCPGCHSWQGAVGTWGGPPKTRAYLSVPLSKQVSPRRAGSNWNGGFRAATPPGVMPRGWPRVAAVRRHGVPPSRGLWQ